MAELSVGGSPLVAVTKVSGEALQIARPAVDCEIHVNLPGIALRMIDPVGPTGQDKP